jgi:excisionase family DNA binding protein
VANRIKANPREGAPSPPGAGTAGFLLELRSGAAKLPTTAAHDADRTAPRVAQAFPGIAQDSQVSSAGGQTLLAGSAPAPTAAGQFPEGKVLLSIDESCRSLGVGRTKLYSLIGRDKLTAVKIGRSTRLRVVDVVAFVESLPATKPKTADDDRTPSSAPRTAHARCSTR